MKPHAHTLSGPVPHLAAMVLTDNEEILEHMQGGVVLEHPAIEILTKSQRDLRGETAENGAKIIVTDGTHDEFSLRDEIRSQLPERHSGQYSILVTAPLTFELLWALDDLFATTLLADHPEITATHEIHATARTLSFRLISGAGATVDDVPNSAETIVIPPLVAGMSITTIASKAGAGSNAAQLFLPAPLRSIGNGAFAGSSSLTRIVFPNTIERIGTNAFSGCSALASVKLPRGLQVIENLAFSNSPRLKRVQIPPSVRSIGEHSFKDVHAGAVFEVQAESYAHLWATTQGFAVELTDFCFQEPQSFTSQLLEFEDVEYRTLPGRQAEIRRVLPEEARSSLQIPQEVAGYTVRGLARGAVSSDTKLRNLSLPTTIRWIAPEAVSPDSAVVSMKGLNSIQAIGTRALPEKIRSRRSESTRTSLDADRVHLSLRMVCTILDIDLPSGLEEDADAPFSAMAGGLLTSSSNTLYFGEFLRESSDRVERLIRKGVPLFISNRQLKTRSGKPLKCVIHPRPQQAFAQVCRWVADQFNVKKIAITGSVGKTTSKEFVRLVCSSAMNTLYSKGNQNGITQIGRHLQLLTAKTEVYIQETGAMRTGLIEAGSKMLRPDAFVVTNIGMSHIENYGGSQDNILADKTSHDRYLPDDGVAFLNFDDAKLKELHLQHTVIGYSLDDRDAAYYAENIRQHDGLIELDICDAAEGTRTAVRVHAFGKHNALNAVLAFAVGRWLRIPVTKIVDGIGKYRAEGVRQNLITLAGHKIFADCYNASLESTQSAIAAFQTITLPAEGRRRFVFGDINELGDHSETIHAEVGRSFADQPGIEKFYCFGPHSAHTAAAARSLGVNVFHTEDRETLHTQILQDLGPSDMLAFKASHGVALPITIDALFGTTYTLADADLVTALGSEHTRENIRYRSIKEFGVELRQLPKSFDGPHLVVPQAVDGQPVVAIGRQSCVASSITSVAIPAPIRTIAYSAFFNSPQLTEVQLPSTLKYIGRSAFNGCSKLRELIIPAGTQTIAARAFYGCRNLRRIYIPSSVRTIDDEVFTFCPNLTVVCEAGSYTESFCRERWPEVKLELKGNSAAY